MVKPLESLTLKALELPEDQRITLAHRILTSIEAESSNEWDLEIRERIEAYDKGQAKTTPASEVFQRIDKALSRET